MHANQQITVIQGLKTGDQEAWLMLYDAYARKVWDNVSRLVNDSAAVPDIVQDTFLAAAQCACNYDPKRGTLWVWLWGIARRQIALHFRKQSQSLGLERLRSWWHSLDTAKRMMLANLEAPINLLASHELGDMVRLCLTRLNTEHQLLLMAKYLDEHSVDHIARQLACSPVAVRSKLARARKAFRREFNHITKPVPAVGSVNHDR